MPVIPAIERPRQENLRLAWTTQPRPFFKIKQKPIQIESEKGRKRK
jgi:hypothetical protein